LSFLSASSPRRRRIVSWPLAVEPYFQRLPGSREFLLAVAEDPCDGDLRLVFADWLEDQGEADRAEFIRVQVRPEAWAVVWPRFNQLLQTNQERWLAGLPVIEGACWPDWWNFDGGLLERLHVNRTLARDEWERVFASVDVRHLETRYASPDFFALPLLARLVSLNLMDGRIGDIVAAALAASSHLSGLASLVLEHNYIGPGGARALASSPHLPGLTSLDLRVNDLGDEGARALADSPHLGGLTSLVLRQNEIRDEEVIARLLARWPFVQI
jgi:uncharacterized protein (TIGR02996 family)